MSIFYEIFMTLKLLWNVVGVSLIKTNLKYLNTNYEDFFLHKMKSLLMSWRNLQVLLSVLYYSSTSSLLSHSQYLKIAPTFQLTIKMAFIIRLTVKVSFAGHLFLKFDIIWEIFE